MNKRIILIILFIALTPFSVFSQEEMTELKIVGQPEYLPNEFIAKDKVDINGDVCSGIIIYTDLTGLKFDSNNGIVDMREEPGKIFLFLQHSELVLDVLMAGYKPKKIILDDIGITLQSGKVWKIEITGDKKQGLVPISIVTNVENPAIYIDGEFMGNTASLQVLPGKYDLVVMKEGYKPVITEIEVSLSNTLFQYDLEVAIPVMITIKSEPEEATIFLNGAEKGITNKQLFETAGTYDLRLQKYGYADHTSQITVEEEGENEFSISLTKSIGTISFRLSPPDAEVFINGRLTNERTVELQPGDHVIEVRKENYLTKYDTISIAPAAFVEKDYSLVKNTTQLTLNIIPGNALIKINNRAYTNVENLELAEGTYLIEVIKEGYNKFTETIKIERNKNITKDIKLISLIGKLQLSVQPIDAQVRLFKDNVLTDSWSGSIFRDSLTAGNYEIRVKAIGYKDKSIGINIKPEKVTVEEVTLEPETIEFVKVNNIIGEGSDLRKFTMSKEGDAYLINYDIVGDLKNDYEVNLYLIDSGDKGFQMRLNALSGDFGKGKYAGMNKEITWNYLDEIKSRIDNENLSLKLVVEKIESGGSTWYYYVGAALLGGVAAAVLSGGGGGDTGDGSSTTNFPNPPGRP